MAVATVKAPGRLFARPLAEKGWWSWITTVDHKKLGIMYGVTAFVFFLFGGLEALLIRAQLAKPDGTILSADQYNQMFTMHGTTMIFLVVMPMASAFGNYLLPLLIGARDVAFPRINALGYWLFLVGGVFLYSSFFLGGATNGGWFGYAPQTIGLFNGGGNGIDFWLLALLITGTSSLTGSINFIVTTLNLRAPGMTLLRMPVFAWMNLVIALLLLFAVPVITVAFIFLYFDRNLGTNFYSSLNGGNPLLWQHLFWIFGHPEVYILILPAMGIVSEIVPVFARRAIASYAVAVFSGVAIGFQSWGVWAHHMFAVGLGPVATQAFSVSTILISVPTGIMIFNWLATTWRGDIRLTTPMLFALGFIAQFTIGGLSGATHTIVPHDFQQTDTYYIVAHFHYVLFGGAIFGLFGGLYYWWPKIFGHHLSESIGKLHFWVWIVGFNMTFGPMHIVGLQGQPRRTYRYPDGMGWTTLNFIQTIGAGIIALGALIFLANAIKSRMHRDVAGDDPWDARTLEWMTSSPPPPHNFDEIPIVTSVDEAWHRKYVVDDKGRRVRVPAGGADGGHTATSDVDEGHHGGDGHGEGDHGHGIHMPSPSYYPVILSIGLGVIGYGLIYSRWLFAFGVLMTTGATFGWVTEPATEPDADDAHSGHAAGH